MKIHEFVSSTTGLDIPQAWGWLTAVSTNQTQAEGFNAFKLQAIVIGEEVHQVLTVGKNYGWMDGGRLNPARLGMY
jgi:hypothetical protein